MKLWKRCLVLPLFPSYRMLYAIQCDHEYLLRSLMISSFFFFFRKKRTRKLKHSSPFLIQLRHISSHRCPSFSPKLADVIIKDWFILSTSRLTPYRTCGFGKISRNCLDLLDTPFHTFFFVFHTFLGLRFFFFFWFFCLSIASSPKSFD